MKITNYRFGHIEVGGLAYSSEFIITPEGVQDGAWRKEGHNLAIEDLDTVVAAKPDTLNSHSAIFNQLPCFGVYTNSSLFNRARATWGSNALYKEAPVCVFKLSMTKVIRLASAKTFSTKVRTPCAHCSAA